MDLEACLSGVGQLEDNSASGGREEGDCVQPAPGIGSAGQWLLLPLPHVTELLAEQSGEVALLAVVCRDFWRRLWDTAEGWQLRTPCVALHANSDPKCIQKIHLGSVRHLSVRDSPAVLGERSVLLERFLTSALALRHLQLSFLGSSLQSLWISLLECMANALQVKSLPLQVFRLDGMIFPAAAAHALGDAIGACCSTLREVSIDFADTSGEGPLDDARLWAGFALVEQLKGLHLAGLRTSASTCHGLTQILRRCSKTLRSLRLGNGVAESMVAPPSVLEVEPAVAATQVALLVSPEFQELLSAGEPLQLHTLALSGLKAPLAAGQGVGLSPHTANLAALLEAAVLLSGPLTSLDISQNLAIAAAPLVSPSGVTSGEAALHHILEACASLTALDVSHTGFCILELSPVLAAHGATLLELRLEGCSIAADVGPHGERRVSKLAAALGQCEHLQVLELGELGIVPALRRPLQVLLQRCAPTLRCLRGTLPLATLELGLSSLFSTGTCRDGGAKQLVDLEVGLTGLGCACQKQRYHGVVEVLNANIGTLQRLRLRAHFGDHWSAALVQAVRGARLIELALEGCGLGPNTARYLHGVMSHNEAWPLQHLALSYNPLGEAVLPLLAAFRTRQRLQKLGLRDCELPAAAAGSALGRLIVALPALIDLDLQENSSLGEVGIRAFLEAALCEWGRQEQSIRSRALGSIALPGHVHLHGSVASEAEASVPKCLGRFKLAL
mmetsp:Transcript_8057/g.15074  ORF Transcript_8057/g.15074 Transcript_8057/m.15074 type:complete len:731 (-) Transcript_8057:25-2217(-)